VIIKLRAFANSSVIGQGHVTKRSNGFRKTVTLFVPKSPPFLLLRLAQRYMQGRI